MKVMLDEGAYMPVKAHPTDAGFDLFAKEDFSVPACSYKKCVDTEMKQWTEVEVGSAIHDTGVHLEIPEGFVGFIKSKSGLNVKHNIIADGTIDSGYTGSIIVKLYNLGTDDYNFKAGDKITQIVILPISRDCLEITDSLSNTDRGDSGFGSTGR